VYTHDSIGLGEDGPTHHGVFDLSYLRHMPGMSILAPKDEDELKNMIYTALSYDGPAAIRYPRGKAIGVPLNKDYSFIPWGKGEIMVKGKEILIVAVGAMVYPALTVRELLLDYGVESTVINARFIKPLDEELILDNIQHHKYLVTMEDNVAAGGFGSAVLELLSQKNISVQTLLLAIPDEFVPHGKSEILKERIGLTSEGMVEKIVNHFELKKKFSKRAKIYITGSK
jgi:1-deoxy-D-xylulose-5-phosphate synthase